MKRYLPLFIAVPLTIACSSKNTLRNSDPLSENIQFADTSDMTNNFYDNTETISLPVHDLIIEGEVSNPGAADFSKLPKRSLIVKEALLYGADSNRFTGAFRYDGYSLMDILDNTIVKKNNADEFQPNIDLFVEVENASGDKVVFSWGEIFYPDNLHNIMIATDVARIVPSKTGELWDLPRSCRIVAGNDLITERNISDPVRIVIRSYPGSFKTVKGTYPLYSDSFTLFSGNEKLEQIADIPDGLTLLTYNTIFYGRGRGIHSTSPFKGILLKELIEKYYPFTRENLRTGIFCFLAKDGYRIAVSYSELLNRNDQQEFLLVKTGADEDGGLFRIFPASDFFSDRALKSLSEVHFHN